MEEKHLKEAARKELDRINNDPNISGICKFISEHRIIRAVNIAEKRVRDEEAAERVRRSREKVHGVGKFGGE